MVVWEYLKKVLRLRGFRQRWQLWIDLWLRLAKVQVLVNGITGKKTVCMRDLWLGDPLSPFIFVLVVDGLNKMFDYAKKVGLVHGFHGCSSISLTYLQYMPMTCLFLVTTTSVKLASSMYPRLLRGLAQASNQLS